MARIRKDMMHFSASEELRKKIEEYASKNSLSISASVSTLLSQQFRSLETSGEFLRVLRGMTDDQLSQLAKEGYRELKEASEVKEKG